MRVGARAFSFITRFAMLRHAFLRAIAIIHWSYGPCIVNKISKLIQNVLDNMLCVCVHAVQSTQSNCLPSPSPYHTIYFNLLLFRLLYFFLAGQMNDLYTSLRSEAFGSNINMINNTHTTQAMYASKWTRSKRTHTHTFKYTRSCVMHAVVAIFKFLFEHARN